MARTYLSAEARCKQLERLVREEPGATIEKMRDRTGMAYTSVCAYATRLVREQRVAVVASPAKPGQRPRLLFFPIDIDQGRKA